MLKSSSGEVWRRSSSDLYVIELTIGKTPGVNETVHHSKVSFRKVFIYYHHTHGPRVIDSALKVLLYEMLHDPGVIDEVPQLGPWVNNGEKKTGEETLKINYCIKIKSNQTTHVSLC